jgi:hypothetical protein
MRFSRTARALNGFAPQKGFSFLLNGFPPKIKGTEQISAIEQYKRYSREKQAKVYKLR